MKAQAQNGSSIPNLLPLLTLLSYQKKRTFVLPLSTGPGLPASAASPSAHFCCLPHHLSSADTTDLLQEAKVGHCNL